jgi:hypothetical protein
VQVAAYLNADDSIPSAPTEPPVRLLGLLAVRSCSRAFFFDSPRRSFSCFAFYVFSIYVRTKPETKNEQRT